MRRFVFISASLGVLLLAVVLLLPWWLGAALPVVGRTWGLGFEGYAREGYSHFRLAALEIRRANVLVRVDDIHAETPLLWLWHRVNGRPSAVIAGTWRVEVQPRSGPALGDGGEHGWMPLKQRLGKIADVLDRWLPRAQTGTGAVRWPGHELRFGAANWEQRKLTVAAFDYLKLHAVPTLVMTADHELELVAAVAGGEATVKLATHGAAVSGELESWGQRAEIAAQFDPRNWAPREAQLRAKHWDVAGARIGLGAYAAVRGDAELIWKDERLSVDVKADGQPREKATAPPLAVDIHGHLGGGEWVADALAVELPGVSAKLSEPLAIDFGGRLRTSGSRFVFEGDLAKLPWGALKGSARGEARISPAADRNVRVAFSATGENVAAAQLEAKRIELSGTFTWPRLEIAEARVELAAGGHALNASGACDFRAHTVDGAVVRGTVPRSAIARWLPATVQFEELEVDARGSGPWTEIAHDGRAGVRRLQIDGMKPLGGEVTWNGRGAQLQEFKLEGQAGGTKIFATGAGNRSGAEIASLSLERGDGEKLASSQPMALRWGRAAGVELIGLRLAGEQTSLTGTLRWAKTGMIDVSVNHLGVAWLRDFFHLPKPEWMAESLVLRGNWAEGPAKFSADGAFTVDLGEGRTARLATRLRGDGSGLKIESLRVAEGEGVIATAAGQFPIVLHPRGNPLVELRNEVPFSFSAATSPNPEFWKKLTELSGFEGVNPELTARLEGTLAKPRGEARFKADRIAALPGELDWKWPKIEGVDVHLTGDEAGVKLDRFTIAVEGQTVRAEGHLPAPAQGWQALFKAPVDELRKADVRVEVPDADLAAVAQYFPAYLAPKGRLKADVSFKSDETINGFLRIEDATSRPLGPLGVLQEVNADVRFEGRAANLAAVSARMGGQLVTLKGRAELPPEGRPLLDLTLTGENLPFVRQAGLLVRGDLDLKLTSESTGRTSLTGAVRLRDSLFLSDIRSMIPTGQKGTATRPPYFAIETSPLNRWRLDVTVEGERFMRLRTPVFNGTASAKLQLTGTLGEPRATGEATVEDGTIRLPFASFAVQQGQVRLTGDQPEPQLFVTATTRRYGYDLRLELTGAASTPNLTFSSSPPLESEQVLLMVMAGQAPHDEIATTDRQRAARFGAFFGQSLLGALGGGGDGADRLTISSGENISLQGRETYSIEYKLNDRWALTGEYDEFDDYYGGVKWRFYEKGGRRAGTKK